MNGIALANTSAYQRHIKWKSGLAWLKSWSMECRAMEHGASIHLPVHHEQSRDGGVCFVWVVSQYGMFRYCIDKNKGKLRGSMARAESERRVESHAMYAMYAMSVRNVGK